MIRSQLQLHQFDFHALVELSVLLHRAGLGLQLLQLSPGSPAPQAALHEHHRRAHSPVRAPRQPAAHCGLKQHGGPLGHQLKGGEVALLTDTGNSVEVEAVIEC